MPDIDFDDEFVTAVNRHGNKQRIPAKWLDHPVLGAGFTLPPSARAAQSDDTVPAVDDVPSLAWNRQSLLAHATRAGIDVPANASKADILTAITAAQTPDGTPSSDETPATGDDKES